MPEPPQELDALANKVIGAAIEVHRHPGPGFLESVYEEALATELDIRNIAFERQKLVQIVYKTHGVGEHRLDFLVKNGLVVELKSVDSFSPLHKAQLISLMRNG